MKKDDFEKYIKRYNDEIENAIVCMHYVKDKIFFHTVREYRIEYDVSEILQIKTIKEKKFR